MAVQAVIAQNGRLDWLGVLCSFGCAIHCAAMPVVIATLPSLTSIEWLADPLFHQVIAVVCGVLVARAILPSYKVHRDSRVLAMAGFGMSLLFIAAFILPDACCSVLQMDASRSSLQRPGQVVEFEGGAKASKIVLVSSSGSTMGKLGDVREYGEGSKPQPSEMNFLSRPKVLGSTISTTTGEHDACEHARTYGRPLLSAVELASHLGISGAQRVIWAQPFLSPLGGLFLIMAHVLNIRLRICGRSKCCVAGR